MTCLLKLIPIVVLLNNIISCTAYQSRGCTNKLSAIERMASLRKRSLLLPTSGSVKLTIGLGKALVGSSPKGLSQSWEISTYYAGPTSLKDWLNSVPQKPMKIPAGISNGTSTMKKGNLKINTKRYQNLFSPDYTNLNTIPESYSTFKFGPKHQESFRPLSPKNARQQFIDRRHTTVKLSHSDSGKRNRSKRQSSLYDILTDLFGTDFKCAIVSSICRSLEFLLPPGYSMIHDIVRLIYLTPSKGYALDNVPPNTCATQCDPKYESERSFNFLNWILNPVQVV